MNAPFNRHGGLTLLPMPGFRTLADAIAARIAAVGSEEGGTHTPVDIAEPEFGLRSSGEPFLRLGQRHGDLLPRPQHAGGLGRHAHPSIALTQQSWTSC